MLPEKIKSARVIEDPDEIYKFITQRAREHPSGPAIRTHSEEGYIIEPSSPTGIVVDKGRHKLPSADELKVLVEARGMPWRDDFVGRSELFWTSDERVDGDGDIVRQNWDFSRYEKLSRVLHAHNWAGLPIGRSVRWDIVKRNEEDFKGPALLQVFLFAPQDVNPMGELIRNMVKARFLTETSVGFLPLKIIHVEDEDERAKLGLGRWGLIFDRSKLIETSTCAVACNEGAHVLNSLKASRDSGFLKADHQDMVRSLVAARHKEDLMHEESIGILTSGFDKTVCDVFKELFPTEVKEPTTTVTLDDADYVSIERLQKQIDEIKKVQAEVAEELIGWFKNLKAGLVDLYPTDRTIQDSVQGKQDPEDKDDDDDDDEELLDELDDDDDDDDESVESDPNGRSQPVGSSYLEEIFGDSD